MTNETTNPVLVTTSGGGVFFGYIAKPLNALPKNIEISGARNCVSWDDSVKGVFGLAVNGPSDYCRIGPKMPAIFLANVTAVVTCTTIAAKRWEKAPWTR